MKTAAEDLHDRDTRALMSSEKENEELRKANRALIVRCQVLKVEKELLLIEKKDLESKLSQGKKKVSYFILISNYKLRI